MILLAFLACAVVGLIAWVLIPAKPKNPSTNGNNGGPPAAGVASVLPTAPITGPNALSVEEKMAVVEAELRRKQAEKFRDQTIAEISELLGAPGSNPASTTGKK